MSGDPQSCWFGPWPYPTHPSPWFGPSPFQPPGWYPLPTYLITLDHVQVGETKARLDERDLKPAAPLSDAEVDRIARRVVELMREVKP